MTTLITIVAVSLLIILHELGHYWAARACGMRVLRFSVGFGPSLLRWQRGDTTWQLAAVPVGGYVQVQGFGPEDREGSNSQASGAEGSDGPGSGGQGSNAQEPGSQATGDGHGYRDRPRWQRALFLVAGPVANWIVAAVCLTLLASTVGLRDYEHPTSELGDITPGSAAAQAGLVPGDRIVSVGGAAVADWQDLVREVRKHPAETVTIEIERAGERVSLQATPARSSNGEFGVLGIEPAAQLVRYGLGGGLAAGVRATVTLTREQARLLWGVITGQVEGRLSGLPGIVRTLSAQAKRGVGRFFETLATLSVVLFILNLVPIPGLDGARLTFLGIEAVRRRPVSETIEGWVHGIGLVLLLALIVLVSVRDLL
jgi:regulator of sigma E protease